MIPRERHVVASPRVNRFVSMTCTTSNIILYNTFRALLKLLFLFPLISPELSIVQIK